MARSTRKIEDDETIQQVPSREKRAKAKQRMQPPLTPMIDVTFQLLLFFLLTCEFRESEGGIPGTLPVEGNLVGPPPVDLVLDPIQVRLRASHDRSLASYEMTGVSVVINSPKELFEYLKARQDRLGTDEVPVVILPNQDVPWEFVVEAFNQAVRARYKKIGFGQQSL